MEHISLGLKFIWKHPLVFCVYWEEQSITILVPVTMELWYILKNKISDTNSAELGETMSLIAW